MTRNCGTCSFYKSWIYFEITKHPNKSEIGNKYLDSNVKNDFMKTNIEYDIIDFNDNIGNCINPKLSLFGLNKDMLLYHSKNHKNCKEHEIIVGKDFGCIYYEDVFEC